MGDTEQKEKIEEEEMTVDNDKLSLLLPYKHLVNILYDTDLVTDSLNNRVKIRGSSKKREKTRKFIHAVCNPEHSSSMKIDQAQLKRLNTNDFKNQLMRDHTTLIYVTHYAGLGGFMDNHLFLQGIKTDVDVIKEKLHGSEDKLDDSDIIWLDVENNNKNVDVITLDDTVDNNSIECQMHQMQLPDKLPIPVSVSSDLKKTAQIMGFTNQEIEEAYASELKSRPDRPVKLDFIVEYMRKKREKCLSTSTTVSNTSAGIELSPRSLLREYSVMFSSQSFESSDAEAQNKIRRIQALIAAMPAAQKSEALYQLSQIQANRVHTAQIKRIHQSDSCTSISSISEDVKPTGKINLPNKKKLKNSTESRRSRSSNQDDILKSKNSQMPCISLDLANSKVPIVHSAPCTSLAASASSTSMASSVDSSQSPHLRFIIIDGSNVAREHGKESGAGRSSFSCRGIQLVVDFFAQRGHTQIRAMLPRFRRGTADKNCPTTNPEILDLLETRNQLTYTPSRYVQNTLIIPYDDRFIIKAAIHHNALIVSNDNYRDLMQESSEWKRYIEANLLQYSFVGDLFLIADDPMGWRGPNLNQLLSTNHFKQQYSNQQCQNQQHVNQKTNYIGKNFPQGRSQSKPSENRPRTQEETSFLHKKLVEVFPQKHEIIRRLLQRYPHNFDIDFFSEALLME